VFGNEQKRCSKLDREDTIQEIAEVITQLEDCSTKKIESVKKFLRWLNDDALQDIKSKHEEALQSAAHGPE